MQTPSPAAPRVLRRYANRKIYDPYESRYVNHAEIAALVRAGSQVRVLDRRTQRDVTVPALARILSLDGGGAAGPREEALLGLLRADGTAAAAERDLPAVPEEGAPAATAAADAPPERVVSELLCHGQRGAFVARRLLADRADAVARLEGRARAQGEEAVAVLAALRAVRGQLEGIARRLERLDERLSAAEDA